MRFYFTARKPQKRALHEVRLLGPLILFPENHEPCR
jgi:hypothetical protein